MIKWWRHWKCFDGWNQIACACYGPSQIFFVFEGSLCIFQFSVNICHISCFLHVGMRIAVQVLGVNVSFGFSHAPKWMLHCICWLFQTCVVWASSSGPPRGNNGWRFTAGLNRQPGHRRGNSQISTVLRPCVSSLGPGVFPWSLCTSCVGNVKSSSPNNTNPPAGLRTCDNNRHATYLESCPYT